MLDEAAAATFARIAADQLPLSSDPELRRRLGSYIAAAVPDFYGLLPIDAENLADALGSAIGLAGSELEHASMGRLGREPIALVTWLPLERLDAARRAGTIALLREVDRNAAGAFLAAVAQYGKTVEPIDGKGVYLSRVTVDSGARGMGLGKRAVMEVIEAADGADIWLHVAKDNTRAIQTYEALGFGFATDGDYSSRAMKRPHE